MDGLRAAHGERRGSEAEGQDSGESDGDTSDFVDLLSTRMPTAPAPLVVPPDLIRTDVTALPK
jgi:hypothetical protein